LTILLLYAAARFRSHTKEEKGIGYVCYVLYQCIRIFLTS
jgi:hypothetical protein